MARPRIVVLAVVSIAVLASIVPTGAGAQVDLLSEGERNDSAESARVISSGTSIRGTIVADDEDWFSFVANRGESVRLAVGNDFSYVYFLFDPDGEPIESVRDGDFISFEAPVSGEFLFRMVYTPSLIDDVDPDATYTGEYVLHLGVGDAIRTADRNELNDQRSDATRVPVDGTVHGVLERDDQEWFTFGAERGTEIRIISLHGGYSSWWGLYDGNGNRVEMNFGGDLVTATAPTTGQYFLRIRYDQEWLEGRSPNASWSAEYVLLFDFDVRSVESMRTEAVDTERPDTGPVSTPREGPSSENGNSPIIVAAVIGGVATIIAAILARR
jgi:hypothetical protein